MSDADAIRERIASKYRELRQPGYEPAKRTVLNALVIDKDLEAANVSNGALVDEAIALAKGIDFGLERVVVLVARVPAASNNDACNGLYDAVKDIAPDSLFVSLGREDPYDDAGRVTRAIERMRDEIG